MFELQYLQSPCLPYTFQPPKIRYWVQKQIRGTKILNLCAGKTILHPQEIRVDTDPSMPNIHYRMRIEKFIKIALINNWKFETIVFDPPWDKRKSKMQFQGRDITRNKESKKDPKKRIGVFTRLKDDIVKLLLPEGRIITAGLQITYFGKIRGFEKEIALCVDPCGEQTPFYITVEIKRRLFDGL